MQALNNRYPQWNEGEEYARYHMNRAAIANRWDQVLQMLDVYIYGEDEQMGIRLKEFVLRLGHSFGYDQIGGQIEKIYGMQDVMGTLPGIYYTYRDGIGFDKQRKEYLRDVLFKIGTPASPYTAASLVGYVDPKMKTDAMSSIWWYDLQNRKKDVANVIEGNYDHIPYSKYIDIHRKNLVYPQILASSPIGTQDRPNVFSILTKADIATMETVYASMELARKGYLLLQGRVNPCMLELMPSYIGRVTPSPISDLAISLSGVKEGCLSLNKEEEEEFEIL